jgi:hypothetical protein
VGHVIADWTQTPGAVGILIRMTEEAKLDPNDPRLGRREVELMDRLRDMRARLFDLAVREAAKKTRTSERLQV